jgi:hypothetical protein
MSNLYKLVYTSSRRPHCDEQEIQNILDACRRNNPGKDVTGILLHSKKRFLQYLEGEKDELMELFNYIKQDNRHGGVNMRYYSPIDERIFPSWQMGYKDLDQQLDFQTSISTSDQEIFNQLITDEEYNETEGVRILKLFFEMA